MAELVNDSTEQPQDAAAYAASLMRHYGFDLGGDPSDTDAIALLLRTWQEQYPASWIRLATIEALYQGRYKAISVEQILALWQRRSQPVYHFNHEFERLICDRLPQALVPPVPPVQEESFSMRSAQAMIAHLQSPTVTLPYSNRKTARPHHSDAMQALRSLHDVSAETMLAARGAEPSAAPEPSLTQTYSYTVRSETVPTHSSPAKTTTDEAGTLAENPVDPGVPSGLLPSDPNASLLGVSAERLQADAIAPLESRSSHEQLQETNLPTESTVYVSHDVSVSHAVQVPPTTPQATSITRILQQLDNQEVDAKALFPGLGLLDETLQPKLRLQLTARYQPLWLTDATSKQPIHQFTPDPEASDFHTKLKLVAQVPEAVPDDASCEPLSKEEDVEK